MMEFVDNFESAFTLDELNMLLKIGNSFQVSPESSIEMEAYFVGLLKEARESGGDIELWLRERVWRDFKCIGKPPEWIQNADWQLYEGKPMIFVGQIDAPQDAGLFHDESSFYLFLAQTGRETRVVIQVS